MRRTSPRSFASAAAALLLLAGSASADQILQIHPDTLTVRKGTGSTGQQVLQLHELNRGVGIDGSARLVAPFSWAFSGNPFGDAMSPLYRVGDVNLSTGQYSPTDIDMALPAPGMGRITIGRTYNGGQANTGGTHQSSEGYQGINWQQFSHPEIKYYSDSTHSNDVIYLAYGADRYLEFQRTGSSSDYFQGRNGAAGVMVHVTEFDAELADNVDYYVYYDQNGTKTYFLGSLNTGSSAWQFWKIVDAAGNEAFVGDDSSVGVAIDFGGYDSFGRIAVAYDSAERRYTYTYSGSMIGFNYRLTQVKAETKASGTWASPSGVVTVGQVDYAYYSGTVNDEGLAGDLKLVTVTTPLTDSGISSIRKKNYWYYTRAWSNSAGRRGEAHEVKMVIGNEGYRKYDWLDSDLTNDDPLSATESDLEPYADAYIEYADTGGSSPYRVSSAYFNGECGCSGGANGTYTITYAGNGSYTDNSGYDTAWCKRAVVTQPDSNYCTYYFDEVGQPLSRVVTNADPTGSPTKTWATGVERDSNGCVTYIHTPANLNTYTNSTGALTYHSAAGLVNAFDRVPSGDRTGLLQARLYQEGYDVGSMPTSYYTSRTTYTQQDLNIDTGVNVTRPLVATSRVYPGATDYATPNASGTYNETSMTYYWWSGTNTDPLYITLAQVTTTLPSVAAGNNGSGSSNTTDRYLRPDGTTAFTRASDNVYDYTQFTNGQLTEQIRDVSTNGSFPGGEDPQSDFGIGDNATHSNRVTTYTYDAQGRPLTTTLPTTRVMENYYSCLKDQRVVRVSWPRSVTVMTTTTRYGPAQYSVISQAGKSEASGVIAITSSGLTSALTAWIDETTADPITAVTEGTLASLHSGVYSNAGRMYLRRTQASYPGGSDLVYSFPSASNALNDAAGWVASVTTNSVQVAGYFYDGSGLVVDNELNEPAASWIKTSGATYTDMDNFNRVTECLWKVKKTTLQTLYDVGLTYDRNSNITSAADAIKKNSSNDPNFDAVYTMDNLNRLTSTDEGKLSSGVIAMGKHSRYEQWTLDQVGNMTEDKLDLNGDGDYVDAGEMDDTRAYSVANELSTRDTDSNSSVNYTLSYDNDGNTTDDGKDYVYIWDAFGRLRQVKTRGGSPALVADYRYNGLGYRIGWHYDVTRSGGGNPDGTVDSNDPWYFFAYDDRWRMINTFRGSDSDPKERFIYHNAGFGGFGGSSYIDSVVVRDKDDNSGWASAADGTLEQRRYYVQNWRSDVSAVITDGGNLVESVKYSSYGVPIGLPAGDIYSTGVWSKTESDAITFAIGGALDPRMDVNMDGAVDAADVTAANAVTGGFQTIGRSTLSSMSVANRLSYSGGQDELLPSANKQIFRHRIFDTQLGKWLSRDSLEYLDETSAYAYNADNPITMVDPSGECATRGCSTLEPINGPQASVSGSGTVGVGRVCNIAIYPIAMCATCPSPGGFCSKIVSVTQSVEPYILYCGDGTSGTCGLTTSCQSMYDEWLNRQVSFMMGGPPVPCARNCSCATTRTYTSAITIPATDTMSYCGSVCCMGWTQNYPNTITVVWQEGSCQ